MFCKKKIYSKFYLEKNHVKCRVLLSAAYRGKFSSVHVFFVKMTKSRELLTIFTDNTFLFISGLHKKLMLFIYVQVLFMLKYARLQRKISKVIKKGYSRMFLFSSKKSSNLFFTHTLTVAYISDSQLVFRGFHPSVLYPILLFS